MLVYCVTLHPGIVRFANQLCFEVGIQLCLRIVQTLCSPGCKANELHIRLGACVNSSLGKR